MAESTPHTCTCGAGHREAYCPTVSRTALVEAGITNKAAWKIQRRNERRGRR